MAAATAEISIGKKVIYYPLHKPMRTTLAETHVHRTMNNFATITSCAAAFF
jgi:hypothetical protein